jgi:deoxyhypusine synthase
LAKKQSKFLRGRLISPAPIRSNTKLVDLIDNAFLAYNAARLREACWLFTQKMLEPDVTVGVTLTGALTPAGLGMSAVIPLIKAGFIDWIISTGANFYHDTHFGLGLKMHEGNAQTSDIVLRDEEVVKRLSFSARCRRRNFIISPAVTSGSASASSDCETNRCYPRLTNMQCRSILRRRGIPQSG